VKLALATLAVKEKQKPNLFNLVMTETPETKLKAYLKAIPEKIAPPQSTSRGSSRGLNSRTNRSRDASGSTSVRRKGTVKRMKKTLKALNALKGIGADQPQTERSLTLAEYEIEDKCKPVNPNLKDGRVYYYHLAGAVSIRREIFFTMCEQMQEQSQKQAIADQEVPILDMINEKADKIEEKYIV
jgi:hypothetical protein